MDDKNFLIIQQPTDIEVEALYNSGNYLNNYLENPVYAFYYSGSRKRRALLNLHVGENLALNASFSSFGGLEHNLSSRDLKSFIEKVKEWCYDNGIEKILIKEPSAIYRSNIPQTEEVLEASGFEVFYEEINQHIPVLSDPFYKVIQPNQRRRLRMSMEKGFFFTQLPKEKLRLVYDLIKVNRQRKNYPVTTSFKTLEMMFENLPSHYLLFGVQNKLELIAAAICIRVSDKVLYTFYLGDKEEYLKFSPVVMLLEGIYDYVAATQLKLIDLGISSEKGNLNKGLFQFKKDCGGITTSKKSWVLNLQ